MTAEVKETVLREEIAIHRQELAETVDALAAKLDLKSKAKARAALLRPYAVPAGAAVAALVALVVWRKRS